MPAEQRQRFVSNIDQESLRMQQLIERLLHLGLGLRNRSQELLQEQRTLVKALARGDGDTAHRVCREQIESARNMVLSAVLTSKSIMNVALTVDGE